jgi:hypothetical protein
MVGRVGGSEERSLTSTGMLHPTRMMCNCIAHAAYAVWPWQCSDAAVNSHHLGVASEGLQCKLYIVHVMSSSLA